MNNASPGGIKPKEGDNAVVINRAAGFKQAMGALDNQTKSPHGPGSMNNSWIRLPGSGTGGNVCGYTNGDCRG